MKEHFLNHQKASALAGVEGDNYHSSTHPRGERPGFRLARQRPGDLFQNDSQLESICDSQETNVCCASRKPCEYLSLSFGRKLKSHSARRFGGSR